MKTDELQTVAASLGGDFRSIEPHLRSVDKHLTLRTYLDGFALGPNDTKSWQSLRANKAAMGFIRKNTLANLSRWFTYIEQVHPELGEEAKAADAAVKAKTVAASKAGANYNLALQDADKGVVTRFLPEPS